MKPRASVLVLVLGQLAIAGLIALSDRPPASLPASSPATEFSGERAIGHVVAIAREPHPLGSKEHDRVRDYIVAQLEELGLKPEVQRTIGVYPMYQSAGRIENVLARLRGQSTDRDAVLLMAHYDSVPSGPGAADDAAGVAVLLETLRALRSGPTLRRDVIVLFSDGEEDALLGASAFANEHDWARDVRLALNFDSRGVTGQAGTYETSTGNGLLIRTLAEAYPHVQTTSLYYEIYKRLPNDSDLSVLKRAGAAAMNFGFARNFEPYHTRLDRPDSVDHGSVQQLGGVATALTKRFADGDLRALRAGDAVFFTLPIVGLVHYPVAWSWPLLIGAAAVWLAAAWRLFRRGQTRARAVLGGALAQLVAALLTTALAFGLAQALNAMHGSWLPAGPVYTSVPYALGLLGVVLVAWTLLFSLVRQWFAPESLILGSGLLLLVLGVVTTASVAGATYLVLWPLFAIALSPFVLDAGDDAGAPKRLASLLVLSAPALLILVGALHSFLDVLGVTPEGGLALGLICALLLVSLAPAIQEVQSLGVRLPASMLASLALLMLVLGAASTRYSPEHPEPITMLYALDADKQRATWATDAERPNSWTSQFFRLTPARAGLPEFAYSPFTSGTFLQASAPVASLAAASVTVVRDERSNGQRLLTLRVQAPAGARAVVLLAPKERVVEADIGGRVLGPPEDARFPLDRWVLLLYNAAPSGEEITLRLKGDLPVPLASLAVYAGVAAAGGPRFQPRPPELMQQHSGDRSLVRKELQL